MTSDANPGPNTPDSAEGEQPTQTLQGETARDHATEVDAEQQPQPQQATDDDTEGHGYRMMSDEDLKRMIEPCRSALLVLRTLRIRLF